MKYFIIIFFVLIASNNLIAEIGILSKQKVNPNLDMVFRLYNGDLLTGAIVEFLFDEEYGEGVRVKTELGVAIIYEDQIVEIRPKHKNYRHSHRIFLLPTAEPIGDNHFIGAFELLFFYIGFGISDIFSFTAGRSAIPFIASQQQLSLFNAKATVLSLDFDEYADNFKIAVGGNMAYLNHNNRFIHLYSSSTINFYRTSLTATLFYKMGSEDIYDIRFANNLEHLIWADGAFGLAMGLDYEVSNQSGLRVIGEIWNSDVTTPSNTGILLGLRHCNTKFSADFGLAFFTQPFFAPFASFVWTPF